MAGFMRLCQHDKLILNEDLKKDGKIHYCRVCEQRLTAGPNYSCSQCNNYVVHKSCGEPPREMQHLLHPDHILEITKENMPRKCHGCCEEWTGYMYKCSNCNFYLDQQCAFLPQTIKAESHDHRLDLLRRKLSFTCEICGKIRESCMSYFCFKCSLMHVHTQCALFPLTLKVTCHQHRLSLNVNQSKSQQICQFCEGKVDTKYKAYYCSTCDFAAHPRCAAKIDIRDITFDPELKDDQPIETHLSGTPDESTDTLTTQIVDSMINPENGKAEIVTEIKHIWHEHNLKLAVDEPDQNNEKCNGCTQYLSSPYYCCLQCKFFLHKSCADLPRKRLHPLHKHQLTLGPPNKSPNDDGPEIFRCNACESLCNGLVYSCNDCRFQLDIPCSLITTRFTHEGHQHPLFLFSSCNTNSSKCTSCGKLGTRLIRCTANCGFSMEFDCATLPHTIKYGPYEQPFKLSYRVEDDSCEYYCDICEKERDPKHWFYYCEDLHFPAHPKCILEYPRIKFGRTYTYRGVHEHPLTFVERTTDHSKCHDCRESSRSLIFVCVKCDFILDYDCMFKTMTEDLYPPRALG